MSDVVEPLPAWLLAPVAREHRPPVRTQAQLLPLGELDPADFERLCVALAQEEGDPEACRLYGVRGQAQGGIDLFARLPNGRYVTYQCKRYKTVRESDISVAVDMFRAGEWLSRSERFVFCTSQQAVAVQLSEAIERQASLLSGDNGVELVVWDAEELSRRLKTRPRIVLDFFGRAWVEEFCTEALADQDRLDATEIARLRGRLREFYARLFARHDALVLSGAPVWERFVEPDVLRVRHLPQHHGTASGVAREPHGTGDRELRPARALTGAVDALVSERVGARQWLETHRRTLLIGGAGSGKSTLLRWLCLELLAPEPQTVGPAGREGAFVAVWLPFGRWVASIAEGEREVSLPETLRRFFASYAADDLWALVEAGLCDERLVLLVDGLDEWSNEAAADVAADRLQQYLIQRSLPALACTRPEGLRVLRAIDPEWSSAELAPLSRAQQLRLLEGLDAPGPLAERLLGETGRNPRLRQLSANPLLLGLMWRLAEAGIAVPGDAHAVFAEFIGWSIRVQAPARRRVAEVANPVDLDDDEVEAAIAALGLAAQWSASPALAEGTARRALVDFLKFEASLQLGVAEARAQARRLIAEARGAIGLLSELEEGHLVFAHRALQEHLAGRALSRLDADRQRELARAHAADPGWRNTLDALVWMAPTAAAADALIAAVGDASSELPARWALMPLLAQLALAPSLATREARDAALDAACAFVGSDDRTGARGDTVDLLLSDSEPGAATARVAEHLGRWWPCHAADRSGLLDATHTWPPEPETIELWWRALSDEHTATSRKAGALLVDRLGGDAEAGERLAGTLRTAMPLHSRGTALEALACGWPEHPELERWIARALETADPNLRLIAVDHIIRQGRHCERELDLALELADGWIGLDYQRHGQIGDVLARGWPDSDRIREAALLTVDDNRRERPLDISLATRLLLGSHSDHPDVRSWVKKALTTDHPFVTLGTDAWRLVGTSFRDDPEIVATLDAHLAVAPDVRAPELCQTALGLRTGGARDYLLRLLRNPPGWPSAGWPFGTLVRGWSDDEEIMETLRAFARSGDPKVGEVADWLDDVLPEPEATALLLALLRDPQNPRAADALDALARREDPMVRAQAFEVGWARRSDRSFPGPAVADVLLAGFGGDARAPALAAEELRSPEGHLRSIALAARHHASLRVELRRVAVPLPVELRRRLAQRVFETGASGAVDGLVRSWRLESDGMAAAAAASAQGRWVPPKHRVGVVEQAIEALRAPKLHREGEGQAGVCVLLEMGGFSHFAEQRFGHDPQTPLWIEFGTLPKNWWMASRVAAHFGQVRSALGDDMYTRFHSERYPHEFWSAVAPFAAQCPELREATLAFIREKGAHGYPELLRFLAAVRPGSRELADTLVGSVTGSVVDRSQSRTALLLAAELLAQQFSGDDEVLGALCECGGHRPTEGQLLALSIGWRQAPQALAVFEEARRSPFPLATDVWVRLQLMLAGAAEALEALCQWLRYGEGQSWLVAPPTSVALRRTAGDPQFAQAVAERVRASERPSEVGSGSRLLASAGRLDSATRSALEAVCAAALSGADADLVGLDIVAAEVRPLGWTVWDALHGAPVNAEG